MYISEELLDQCDAAVEKSGADSRSEFICDAILHYIAVINMKENSRVLTPALESVIGGKIAGTEDRISRMLFKLAVEVAMMNHLYASGNNCREGYLEELRDYCIQEVAAMNGRLNLRDIAEEYAG